LADSACPSQLPSRPPGNSTLAGAWLTG